MKRFLLVFMMLVTNAAVAQQVQTGLQLDSLMLKMQVAIDVQKDIEVSEIKGVYRITPWHFVPSLNYDFINNRYYLTVSSGPLVSNMINKRQETRKLSAIDRRYSNLEKTSEIKLKSLYMQVIQKYTNIGLSHEILMNDVEIFKIKAIEYANNEIDTEAFLKDRSSILNKIKTHNNEVADIQRFILEIEQLTEYEIELDLFTYYVLPSLITLPSGKSQSELKPPAGGKGGF
jgi:hypothetical protein